VPSGRELNGDSFEYYIKAFDLVQIRKRRPRTWRTCNVCTRDNGVERNVFGDEKTIWPRVESRGRETVRRREQSDRPVDREPHGDATVEHGRRLNVPTRKRIASRVFRTRRTSGASRFKSPFTFNDDEKYARRCSIVLLIVRRRTISVICFQLAPPHDIIFIRPSTSRRDGSHSPLPRDDRLYRRVLRGIRTIIVLDWIRN